MAIKTITDLLLCVYRCHFATIKLFFLYLCECNISTYIRHVCIPVAFMKEDDGGVIAEQQKQIADLNHMLNEARRYDNMRLDEGYMVADRPTQE